MQKRYRTLVIALAAVLCLGATAGAQTTLKLVTIDYPPYTTSERGNGIFMELVSAAFKAQGYNVEWQIVPGARQLEMVRTGEVLAGVNGTKSISDADSNLVQYYTPQMMSIDMVAFYNTKKLPDGPVFEKVSDLKKYSVGLLRGTGSVQVFTNAGVDFTTVDTTETGVKMLQKDRFDLWVIADLVGLRDLGKLFPAEMAAYKYKSVYTSPIELIFSKNYKKYDEYYAKYVEGMKKIKANGTYMKIFEAYFGAGKINKNTLAADFKQ